MPKISVTINKRLMNKIKNDVDIKLSSGRQLDICDELAINIVESMEIGDVGVRLSTDFLSGGGGTQGIGSGMFGKFLTWIES